LFIGISITNLPKQSINPENKIIFSNITFGSHAVKSAKQEGNGTEVPDPDFLICLQAPKKEP
jgi:hypothetical protein